MKTILMIHGPNLNKLGERDKTHYGTMTLADIEHEVREYAIKKQFNVKTFQSNFEGALIDAIQSLTPEASAMIINAGALTHYSYSLYDAIVDSCLPTVEVHISNIKAREPWRAQSVIEPLCIKTIIGKQLKGYYEAVDILAEHIYGEPKRKNKT